MTPDSNGKGTLQDRTSQQASHSLVSRAFPVSGDSNPVGLLISISAVTYSMAEQLPE